MTATIVSVPRYSTLVQLVDYTLSKSSHLTFRINRQRQWVIIAQIPQGIFPSPAPRNTQCSASVASLW